jgi:hypothetical protein
MGNGFEMSGSGIVVACIASIGSITKVGSMSLLDGMHPVVKVSRIKQTINIWKARIGLRIATLSANVIKSSIAVSEEFYELFRKFSFTQKE